MNKSYLKTKNKKDCNGCKNCELVCPKKAIIMIEDKEGFIYPRIDENKCIQCGMCIKYCSNITDNNCFKSIVYAVKNKDGDKRKKSTSGGVFIEIAEYAIANGGWVYGVQYDKDLKVIHNGSNKIENIKKFSISKYVRSDIGNCFEEIKCRLEQNNIVLFTGTPCQNYALKKFLGKKYEKLILCEIICHSNPSPKIFEMFKKNVEIENNKKIKSIFFRSKNNQSHNRPYVEFSDGSIKEYDEYNKAFDSMLISRPSCSRCNFVSKNRKADITIGDFWGINKIHPEFYDKEGISLVIINSERGKQIFRKISDKFEIISADLDEAFLYNHNKNIKENKRRKKFFKMIENGKINDNNIIYYMDKFSKNLYINRILKKIKKILKRYIVKG